jgi:hypothetical protein
MKILEAAKAFQDGFEHLGESFGFHVLALSSCSACPTAAANAAAADS